MRRFIHLMGFAIGLAAISRAQTNDIQTWNREGVLLAGQRQHKEAEAKFRAARTACETTKVTGECPELASILNNLGSLFYSTGRYRDAEPLLERAVAIWSEQGDEPPVLETALHNLGAVYRAETRYAQAIPIYERSLNLRESREGMTAFTLLPILNGFALLQRDIGDYSQSRQLVERAVSIAELYRDRASADAADSFGTLGQILELQGSLADAKTWLGRALTIRERLFGAESTTVVGTLSDLALTARHEGRLQESEDLYRRILRVAASPDTLLNLGRVLFEQRRTKEAEKVFRQAIARAEHPPHPALAEGLSSLAMLLLSRNRYDEAESLLHRAFEIDGHNFAADDPKIASDLSNTAALAFARKRYADAEKLLVRAEAILTKRLPADHPEIGKVMASLAEIRSRQSRWEESEELYARAVTILEQAWGSENPQLLSTLESYSRVLRARQDYAAAARMDLRTTKIRVVQTLREAD